MTSLPDTISEAINASSNNTQSDWTVPINAYTVSVGILFSLIIIFTIIGNSLVVTAVATFSRLRSVTNYFIVSLAIADMMVAVLVMPYSLLVELYGEWRFGWVFCYFWISCDVTCCTASILHLCTISLDRYLAITEPLTYKTRMSKRRALMMICAVYICSSAISFVPIYLGWYADSSVGVELYVDSPVCGLHVNRIYAVISAMTSFYVPLLVMLFVYMKIFVIARRQSAEINKLEQTLRTAQAQTTDKSFLKSSKRVTRDAKAIKTLGTLMGLFVGCWLPFFVMYIVMPFCPQCSLPPFVESAITWLGYMNSFINPCVYAFLNRDFRVAFRRLLFCSAAPISPCCRHDDGLRQRQLDYMLDARDGSGSHNYVTNYNPPSHRMHNGSATGDDLHLLQNKDGY